MKNFRVYYQIDERKYHKDFRSDLEINDEKMPESALYEIKKSDQNVRQEDITNIEESNVW
jgi:hypothetical protein